MTSRIGPLLTQSVVLPTDRVLAPVNRTCAMRLTAKSNSQEGGKMIRVGPDLPLGLFKNIVASIKDMILRVFPNPIASARIPP